MMTEDCFPHQARLYAEKDRLYSSWQLAQREQARGRGLPRSSPGDETHAALGMSPLEPQSGLSCCHTSSQGSEGGVPSSPSLFDSIDAYYRYRRYARVLEPCMQVLSTAPRSSSQVPKLRARPRAGKRHHRACAAARASGHAPRRRVQGDVGGQSRVEGIDGR